MDIDGGEGGGVVVEAWVRVTSSDSFCSKADGDVLEGDGDEVIVEHIKEGQLFA